MLQGKTLKYLVLTTIYLLFELLIGLIAIHIGQLDRFTGLFIFALATFPFSYFYVECLKEIK